MHDDLHEPEHDHLLDHEFYEDYAPHEAEANPMFDHEDDGEDDAAGMLDLDDDQ